jgi:hypothetical protein
MLRDYPLPRADLETLLPDKSTPIVLVKVNVCRLLEPRLNADGFNVLNKGVAIYFPSTGGQTKFHEQFANILAVGMRGQALSFFRPSLIWPFLTFLTLAPASMQDVA